MEIRRSLRLVAVGDLARLNVGSLGHLSFKDGSSNDRSTTVTGHSTYDSLVALRERLLCPGRPAEPDPHRPLDTASLVAQPKRLLLPATTGRPNPERRTRSLVESRRTRDKRRAGLFIRLSQFIHHRLRVQGRLGWYADSSSTTSSARSTSVKSSGTKGPAVARK